MSLSPTLTRVRGESHRRHGGDRGVPPPPSPLPSLTTHGSSRSAATRCTRGTCGTWPHTRSVPHRAAARIWCPGSTGHRTTPGGPGPCIRWCCYSGLPRARAQLLPAGPRGSKELLQAPNPSQDQHLQGVCLLHTGAEELPFSARDVPPAGAQRHLQSGGRH